MNSGKDTHRKMWHKQVQTLCNCKMEHLCHKAVDAAVYIYTVYIVYYKTGILTEIIQRKFVRSYYFWILKIKEKLGGSGK